MSVPARWISDVAYRSSSCHANPAVVVTDAFPGDSVRNECRTALDRA
jgi:hypothetical protein